MDILTVKNPQTLVDKMKNKRFIISAKRTLAGVLTTFMLFNIPTINYAIARNEATHNSYITSVLEDESLSKEQQIAKIYIKAIDENNNIPDETKELLKEAFVFEIIDYSGGFFTKDTIMNMYAVAKTQKVGIIPEFISNNGWFAGDYDVIPNKIWVTDLNDIKLLGHEELHAILKHGFNGTRF